jgi:hypothetical protein
MAALPIIGDVVGKVLDRVLPDKAANDAAKHHLAEMQLSGELQQFEGQLQINLAEAQSKSTFVAGWRPYIGWILGTALAWFLILQPFVTFILTAMHVHLDPQQLPQLNTAVVMSMLGTMLGFGGMRSYDKSIGQSSGQ